ncbi:MAG: prepilin-type N-terminal cleavage/methylation domain-containing protein [Chthoniobacteraceae bacterium]
MKLFRKNLQAFTLAEVIVVAAITAIMAMGILTYSTMMLRMTSRNLAVNHGHDAARASLERLMSDLRNSASQFTLFNVSVSGTTTTYTDVTPTFTGSSDTDLFFTPSQNYLINDNRANGVRYLRLAGTGPYQLTGDGVADSGTIASNSTTLEFDFKNSGYIPTIGDKLQIPLIYSGEYDVIATPTQVNGTRYKVTLSQSTGYTLYTGTSTSNTGIAYNSSNPANTAGYFYQRLAYTVYNNQLRYHPNFTDPSSGGTLLSYPATWTAAATDVPVVVRNNVLSVAPFSLLTSGTGVSTTGLYLRVSLVAYDLNYSSQTFSNGTTTIQAIIPPRSISSGDTILSTNAR